MIMCGANSYISCLVILFFLVSFLTAEDSRDNENKQILCHWSSWSMYRENLGNFAVNNIEPSLCTGIVYNFVGLNDTLDVVHLDTKADIDLGGFANLTALKETHPHLKIILSIGGWDQGSMKFSEVSSTKEYRDKFSDQILQFLLDYGFDGVDIDWEYPSYRGGGRNDRITFPLLLQAVKKKISPYNITLYATVAGQDMYRVQAYDTLAIGESADYVQVMVYDSNLTHHESIMVASSFIVARQSIEYWLRDVPAEKVIMGISSYARTYILTDPKQNDVGDDSTGPGEPGEYTKEPGFLAYYEVLAELAEGMEVVYADKIHFAYNGTNWITYENEGSIKAKARYAMEQDLNGVMLKSIDYDDFNGQFGTRYPLLNAINSVVGLRLDN